MLMSCKVKSILVIMAFVLVFSSFSVSAFAEGEEQIANVQSVQELDNVMEKIEENVQVDNSGINLENKTEVINNITDEELQAINELAKEQGLDIVYTRESLVNTFEQGFKNLNQQIQDGELKALSNDSLVETNDDNFYVQGGSTYTLRYWWGARHYKSTSAAATWSYQGKQLALGHVVAGGAAAFFSLGLGFVIGAVASSYYFAFTNSIDYWNSQSSRGIIADVTYALVYKMRTQ